MSANSTGLAGIVSIACLCTILVTMTVSITKNSRIWRIQKLMKYLYFIATMTNLMQFYEAKRHDSKPNASIYIKPKYWNTSSYFANSTYAHYAMYSLLEWSFKNKYVDNIKKYNHFKSGRDCNFWNENDKYFIYPKYNNLKDEMLNNKIYRIKENEYDILYNECMELWRKKGHKIKAKNVGIFNKKYNISEGCIISINQLIALKIYTDYGYLQKQFKKYYRINVIDGEIYYFFKYLQESCMIFGDKLRKKQKIYSGMKEKLLFDSMINIFNYPLSTTSNINIAQNYGGDNGIVLILKSFNKNSRYFNVSWLSKYQHEEEKLIIASKLKIYDIIINGESSKKYISAFYLIEQFYKGQIKKIYIKNETQQILYQLFILFYKLDTFHVIDNKPSQYIMELFSNLMKNLKKECVYHQTKWQFNLNQITDEKLKCLLSIMQYTLY